VNVYEATVELFAILWDAVEVAWEAADLDVRLEEWWRVVHDPALGLNERQERALQLAREHGRVTNSIVHGCFPLNHPETIRLDLCGLVDMGLLQRQGMNKGTYYVLAREHGHSN